MKKTILTALALGAVVAANASQPLRRFVTLQTESGENVVVTRMGDADCSWWASADGRRFERQAATGMLVPERTMSPDVVDVRNGQHRSMNASTENGLGEYGRSGMGVVKSIGTPAIPVIMAAYSDLDFLPSNDKVKVSRFLNEEGYNDEKYAVGSVGDYFESSSGGMFRPRFDVVAKVTLSNDHKYYGGHVGSSTDARRSELVREAISLAEAQGADFSHYATDGHTPLVSIIFAGPGEQEDYGEDWEDYIWAHFSQSSFTGKTATIDSYLLSNETMRDFDAAGNLTAEYMTGIGTFCHEFGHALGLPDMYDVNGDTNGAGQTPGYWDVMDYQFMYDGFRPMEYSAYERSLMGWAKVSDLVPTAAPSSFTIAPINGKETDSPNVSRVYRLVNPRNPNEYFLLENRRKADFYQSSMLGEGMLVWHIAYDSSSWASNRVNIDASAQRVSVVPADGNWQPNADLNKRDENNQRYTFIGDIFPGYAHVTTFDSHLCPFVDGTFDGSVVSIAINGENVTFNFPDEPTAVDNVLLRQTSTETYYDFQGRPTRHRGGLIIENGRKTIGW